MQGKAGDQGVYAQRMKKPASTQELVNAQLSNECLQKVTAEGL